MEKPSFARMIAPSRAVESAFGTKCSANSRIRRKRHDTYVLRGMFWRTGNGTLHPAKQRNPAARVRNCTGGEATQVIILLLTHAPAAGFSSKRRLTQRTLSAGSW